MDWIHCNKCYYIKTSGGVKLYCGSCSHIICKNCLQTKCPICQKQFNYTEITDKITPKAPNIVSSYFEDLNFSRQNLQKRAKFQWEQRTRLENQQIKIFDEIKMEKKEIIELKNIEKSLKYEIKEDLKKIKEYKILINKMRNGSVSSRSSSKNSYGNLRNSTNSVNSGFENNSILKKDDSGVWF